MSQSAGFLKNMIVGVLLVAVGGALLNVVVFNLLFHHHYQVRKQSAS